MATARNSPKTDRVFQQIKDDIIGGVCLPGTRLPSENSLCEKYNVSRITVRTALNRLAGLGLVESHQGGGSYVSRHPRTGDISDALKYIVNDGKNRISLMELRRILEVESAGLAAVRADAFDVERLRQANLAIIEASAPDDIARNDLSFHGLVAKATKNDYIIRIFEVFEDAFFSHFEQNAEVLGSYGAQYHELICKSIEARDAMLAKRLMQTHLSDTLRRTALTSAGIPDFFDPEAIDGKRRD